MIYGSVCSGIEAASVAWHALGWTPGWFSEIEAFPSAVLAHRWPTVPNLGDMTALPGRVDSGDIPAPDVLVGGTPCQAFSVAGNRESLADARGNLTLTFVELADAIDRQRARRGLRPCIIVWENVPGVLSTRDNAFGCFLAGLAGENVPLQPSGKRWTNAGVVLGPQRAAAWRTLDAQYFGLAQRRRRVFVVASARDGFNPAAVLLEFDGLRRDSAPCREAGQGAAADAGGGATGASERWPAEIGSTLNAHYGSKWGLEDQHINQDAPLFVPAIPILEPGARTGNSTTDTRAGSGIGAAGDPMFTLQAGKQHGVAALAFQSKASASNSMNPGPVAPTLDKGKADGMATFTGMAVRRLTPTECERLQGFPDGHTAIPIRGKATADGPRYKALGNSFAVPVVRWIGQRIQRHLAGDL